VSGLRQWLPTFISMFVCIFSGFIGYQMHQASVVTFDKKALVGRFVSQLSALSLSDDALRTKTDAFGVALTKSLTEYAQRNQVLILDKQQVLAGQNDITPRIAHDVARHMRGHHAD
jgi:type-F conjugative transfer system protein TrbI